MRRSLLRISVAASIMGSALFGTVQTSATAAPVEPVPTVVPAGVASPDATAGTSATGSGCYFDHAGDYVHISSSAFEASGHGWWVNGNCPTSTAVVTVQLQEYYSDGSWRNVGTVGKATVTSGGGAGNRATGRAGCITNGYTSWRSVIDVDLVGLSDDSSKLTTSYQNLYCRR